MAAERNSPVKIHGSSRFDDRTQEVLELSAKFCAVPSISVPPDKADLESIQKVKTLSAEYASSNGLRVIELPADEANPYPFLIIAFSENDPDREDFRTDVALVGHLDVVNARSKKDFIPLIEGDMLVARGAADMKCVVATQLKWMAEAQAKKGPKPPVITMISFCEENASVEGHNTRTAIQRLRDQWGSEVELAIVGERTGIMESRGKLPVGLICDANRGWRWYRGIGDKRINGIAAFDMLADAIRSGRTMAGELNTGLSSVRMKQQANWRTGYVNPFIFVGSDSDLHKIRRGTQVRFIRQGGKARHSASVSPGEVSTAEEFHEIALDARNTFGADKVKLQMLSIGEDGNFNTITGGGVMSLVIADKGQRVDQWKQRHEGPKTAIETISPSKVQQIQEELINMVPIFGLDIREIPEHTDAVKKWIEVIHGQLLEAGIRMQNPNDGEGWECPQNNPHLIKLREAYEKITGEPSRHLGKPHGNDGRFFGGNAVIWGQTGEKPHGPGEAHYIPSILPYLKILDEFAARYKANSPIC
jgi:acetylornithine deacetylase/succinyl-diaminopimelate desuccinylase-like protein